MIETTVVGWKDEDASRGALEWALNRHPRGPVLIAHVVDTGLALVETFAADSPAARARIRLMEVAEQARSDYPSLLVRTELLQGDPVEALTGLSGPQTLVVVSSRSVRGDPGTPVLQARGPSGRDCQRPRTDRSRSSLQPRGAAVGL